MAIDVGDEATTRFNWISNSTFTTILSLGNPANADGVLDTINIFAKVNLTTVKSGTFYGSATTFTNRDYETIGNVTAGSLQTFTGLNCDVSTNDYIGIGYVGTLYTSDSGGSGLKYKSNTDTFGAGEVTSYSSRTGDMMSVYATGATVAAGSLPLKNVFGRPFRGVFR